MVRPPPRRGPAGATLMRRQLHAEEDAAAVEGDVGCVVLLSEGGRARGRFSSGPRLEAGYASVRWVVLCGCWQLVPRKCCAHATMFPSVSQLLLSFDLKNLCWGIYHINGSKTIFKYYVLSSCKELL